MTWRYQWTSDATARAGAAYRSGRGDYDAGPLWRSWAVDGYRRRPVSGHTVQSASTRGTTTSAAGWWKNLAGTSRTEVILAV